MKHNVVYENKNEDLVSSLEILKSKLNFLFIILELLTVS